MYTLGVVVLHATLLSVGDKGSIEKGLCVYACAHDTVYSAHTCVPMCLCWSMHCKRKKTVIGNYT